MLAVSVTNTLTLLWLPSKCQYLSFKKWSPSKSISKVSFICDVEILKMLCWMLFILWIKKGSWKSAYAFSSLIALKRHHQAACNTFFCLSFSLDKAFTFPSFFAFISTSCQFLHNHKSPVMLMDWIACDVVELSLVIVFVTMSLYLTGANPDHSVHKSFFHFLPSFKTSRRSSLFFAITLNTVAPSIS